MMVQKGGKGKDSGSLQVDMIPGGGSEDVRQHPVRGTSNLSRALAMIGITMRSILLNRKTMVVVAILIIMLIVPVIYIMYPPTAEEQFAVEISSDTLTGTAPLNISFTSTTTGGESPYMYTWDFGDGFRSSEEHPTHEYSYGGYYNVHLMVEDADELVMFSEPLAILLENEPYKGEEEKDEQENGLQVAISANRTWGNAPLGLKFRAAVIGGVSPYEYSWDFGDGGVSDEKDPEYVFARKGEYIVKLTVSDAHNDTSISNIMRVMVDPEKDEEDAMDFFMGLIVILYLQMIVLYVCFLYASALITSEVDDRTITYLISRPIRKLEIVVYKYFGYIISLFIIFAIPASINYGILASDMGSSGITDNLDFLLFSLGGMLVGIILWGAFFIFLASIFRNPLMPGFLICIFWESLIANIGTNVSKLTVTFQIRTFIINGLSEVRESIAKDGDLPVHGDLSAPQTFALAVIVSIIFLILSGIKLRGRDFY